jgi:hypothetical protein
VGVTPEEVTLRARVPRVDRVRAFPRTSVPSMRAWLQSLAEQGYVVEVDGDWQATELGCRHFAGLLELDLERPS